MWTAKELEKMDEGNLMDLLHLLLQFAESRRTAAIADNVYRLETTYRPETQAREMAQEIMLGAVSSELEEYLQQPLFSYVLTEALARRITTMEHMEAYKTMLRDSRAARTVQAMTAIETAMGAVEYSGQEHKEQRT